MLPREISFNKELFLHWIEFFWRLDRAVEYLQPMVARDRHVQFEEDGS